MPNLTRYCIKMFMIVEMIYRVIQGHQRAYYSLQHMRFHISLLRLYFDLCLFSCLFTLIVVFVIYCFVLPMWRIKIYISISTCDVE